VNLTPNAITILKDRYLRDGETPEGLFRRVADAVASAELKFGGEKSHTEYRETFFQLMTSLRFLPNSPALVNAGRGGCLSACFVISPEDNLPSIMEVATEAAMIEKWGGGIGFGLSKLRPKGSKIATVHGQACGPVAVMKLYSSVGATLTQGSFRLGAHMGQLHISHPDIREFIHCKDKDDTLQNFNISVQIPDDFMKAIGENRPWNLIDPHTNEVTETVSARDLWNEICESAWKTGDPGVVFIDQVWNTQPNPQLGRIESSNPCGEEMLENYGNCCLGSINLYAHLLGGDIDYPKLELTVYQAVRFLDDVIEINKFPLPQLKAMNMRTRRIGLGVMGWADVLCSLKIPYDSLEAVDLAEKLSKFIHDRAWEASEDLAVTRGPFPEWEHSALKNQLKKPVRHSSVTTIAPTGTISRIAGVSSGIEPYFALAYWSNVLHKGDGSYTRLLDVPAAIRDEKLSDFQLEELAAGRYDDIKSQWHRTATEIDPQDHVSMQAAWQTGVTNSVSKTINLSNDATVEDVSEAYTLAWELDCKAVTVYRDGSKSAQVLETSKPRADHVHEPLERPDSLTGATHRIHTGHGTLYITVNRDSEGRMFEVFATQGKAGGCDSAHMEGLCRLISNSLRSSIEPSSIIAQLERITCCPIWSEGVLVRSAEDAVAHVMRLDSTSHGETLPPKPNGQHCPKCSGPMIPSEGCMRCLDCAYTKCE
jgi:ribonucleoside-diphosphate reductase alpha chain